ncbi:RluA family pseudouridine synthase [Candidatus Falkowbacteria bacterium]|nr:RluA family pseudouridine synthase [Candidatus Falkowbacteria bacterium]
MKLTYTQPTKERLDKFLVASLEIARNKAQSLIKNNLVTVNGNATNPHHFLKSGDIVEYKQSDIKEATKVKKFVADKSIKLPIIKETQDWITLNKPAGMIVHPTEQMEEGSLAAALIAAYPTIKKVGDSPLRPGIVHRLDKQVSGVMIVAKNQKMFEWLKWMFSHRKVNKEYTALVHGELTQDSGIIDLRISRSTTKKRMAAHPQGSELGKEALTSYTVLKRFRNFTLVSVTIHTGRTHQIRAHFNALNHPIVGDKLYKQRFIKEHLDLDRLFLHSTKLEFTDKAGVTHTYHAPLPKELERLLTTLTPRA